MRFQYANGSLYRRDPLEEILIYTGDRILSNNIDFKTECVDAARNIYNENKEIYLALSGGLSSQVCLRSFLEAGIKPNVLIIKFPDNSNIYDTDPAIKICKNTGIVPLIIEVLPTHILNQVGEKLINKYQLYDLFDLYIAYIVGKLGIQILLVDSLDIRRDVTPDQNWALIVNEGRLWTRRFNSTVGKKLIVDNFFTQSKILTGFLNIPIINDLINGKLPGKISMVSSFKTAISSAGFKHMEKYIPTDRTYYLGKLRDTMADEIYKRTLFDNRKFYIPLNEYLTNPEKKAWKHV